MLITDQILAAIPSIRDVKAGMLFLTLQHTSASLAINENADSDVRRDLAMALDHLVPESLPYRHSAEGPDDMPAHVKSTLIGPSLTIPIQDGVLKLGTWQGIYLCEHRTLSHKRQIVISVLS
jgi:secondary thiamine-phosphate synthase enzyme